MLGSKRHKGGKTTAKGEGYPSSKDRSAHDAARGKKILPSSDPSKEAPEGIEAINILRQITLHSDREQAIVGASLLEHSLSTLLKRCFQKLDAETRELLWGDSGPLATFSARISIIYALNIVDKDIKNDLHLIRKIRNEFAHTVQNISFNDPKISELCYRLRTHRSFQERIDPKKTIQSQMTPRQVFLFSVEMLWFFIQGPMTGEAVRLATQPPA